MRLPAAIVMATLIATPALAIDIVSGSGAVIKNGFGLPVVNGAQCPAGELQAVCLDREQDRRQGVEIAAPVEQPREPVDPPYNECGECSEKDRQPVY